MTRYQHKQMLELLETVKTAQEAGFYADCQQGALAIGVFIEEAEGEGTETVALLEDYCELLFKASNGEAEQKTLTEQLGKVERSIREELKPNRLEVLFLPYKASMWDSLESIYNAAAADPQCDAYVVPVPYYTLDEVGEDGLLTNIKCDKDDFPKDVPVTDWQEYNVEVCHPDIIFTHYAYDNLGANLTLKKEYYSENLKKHCELLVYVPYYVLSTDTVEDYNGYLPGVVHSDFVILQSEAIRQAYIAHYNKYDKLKGWNGMFGKAEEKFLALGSPKYDKAVCSKSEDYALPAEWRSIIFKPDETGLPFANASENLRDFRNGSSKKVILYNTHMFMWLQIPELYFKKISAVIDEFFARDDVVLWWRPHPNTELNFKLRRPELLIDYYNMINEFKAAGKGIYDDTPELHRALAWTDGMYSDMSSLVTLCEAAGKPCMIQDADERYSRFVRISAVTDDALWCFAHKFNALFCIDRKTVESKYAGSVPWEHFDEWGLYVGAAVCGGKVYLAPYRADAIAVLDIASGSFSQIRISDDVRLLATSEIQFHHNYKFIAAYAYGHYVYFTPAAYPAIARIDCKTGKLEYFDDFIGQLEDGFKALDGDAVHLFGEPAVCGHKLAIPTHDGKAMVLFDMETCKGEVLRLPEEIAPKHAIVGSVAYDGANYWFFCSKGGRLACWDYKAKKAQTVISADYELYPGHMAYASGYIWLSSPDKSLKVDIRTKEVTVADELSGKDAGPVDGFAVKIISDDTGVLKYVTSTGKYIERAIGGEKPDVEVDFYTTNEIDELAREAKSQASAGSMPCRGYIFEHPFTKLGDFIDAIVEGSLEHKQSSALPTGSTPPPHNGGAKPIGAVIYETMRERCLSGDISPDCI